jgi:hypothetical protein
MFWVIMDLIDSTVGIASCVPRFCVPLACASVPIAPPCVAMPRFCVPGAVVWCVPLNAATADRQRRRGAVGRETAVGEETAATAEEAEHAAPAPCAE